MYWLLVGIRRHSINMRITVPDIKKQENMHTPNFPKDDETCLLTKPVLSWDKKVITTPKHGNDFGRSVSLVFSFSLVPLLLFWSIWYCSQNNDEKCYTFLCRCYINSCCIAFSAPGWTVNPTALPTPLYRGAGFASPVDVTWHQKAQ